MIVWLDGALVAAETARIAPSDRGLTLGDGLFETMLAQGGRVARLGAHLDRLRAGAALLRLALPPLDWPGITAATLAANGLDQAVVRLTVTRGAAARGLLPPAAPGAPTVLLAAAARPPQPPPASCVVATVTRRNERSPLCGVKSLNALDNVLARLEAADRGADDALLRNTAGRLAESTMANLFVVKGGQLHTPPLAEGALPGIMRAAVMARCRVRETRLSAQDVVRADEAFLTNSLGIRPIARLDGRAIGQGRVAAGLRDLADG
ncbi:MAG: aminotransferase class IV [Solidesulfovibrio sp.]|uniref:aminotransferase class IV n=1 Tax=Solidesulfovibrio sp. TaxID=2910990 RepID=UPI002B211C32|nr:aminotransferase class IV [Solidesulfovibrio sp.]MEA4855265.1 aminotransferase class IV [Solidesulfovibrio sp.]